MLLAEPSPLVVDEVPFMAERCVVGTCTGFMMMMLRVKKRGAI